MTDHAEIIRRLRASEPTVRYGNTEFSAEPLDWSTEHGGTLRARVAVDFAPNGGQYVRMASEAENALLDRVAELQRPRTRPSRRELAFAFAGLPVDIQLAFARHILAEDERRERRARGLTPDILPGHSAGSTHRGYLDGCPDCKAWAAEGGLSEG